MNDFAVSLLNWTRVVGAGTRMYTGQGSYTELVDMLGALGIGQGFSGDPISMIAFRPDRSPQPWMYCSDVLKMVKVNVAGNAAAVGVPPPLTAPDVVAQAPNWKVVDRFSTFPPNWTPTGVATAINTDTDDYTIESIVYDDTNTNVGPASMTLTAGADHRPGEGSLVMFEFGNPQQEEVIIQRVLRTPVAPGVGATITSIVYDSTGDSTGTGICSIVLSVPISDLYPHSVLVLDLGGGSEEFIQVISTTVSPTGDFAIRANTLLNHVATEAVEGRASFRVDTALTHLATEAVRRSFYYNQASGTGIWGIERTVNYDLTFTEQTYDPTTGAAAVKRQMKLDDEVHLSLFVLGLNRVVEGKVMFDVDPTTNDFTRNFYYFAFGPNDLVPVSQSTDTVPNTLSAAQTAAQIEATALPTSIPGQMAGAFTGTTSPQPNVRRSVTGDNQWSELRFKLKDMVRVGSAEQVGLSDIKKIRVQMNVNNNIAVIAVASFWIGGTYGPDSGQFGAPYFYRFRARQPNTGARSLTSPATRYGTELRRQQVKVIMPYVDDPQVDSSVGGVLDVYRFGGNVLSWRYMGSVPNNAAGNNTFTDTFPDDQALASTEEERGTFQPFPITDRPKSGTCDVCGSTVIWKTGNKFDTRWAPGTEIKIAGIPYTLFAQPRTFSGLPAPEADFLEIVESAGAQVGVAFVVEEPVLLGQPIQVTWGPTPDTGQIFACGDPRNPGKLYWTNPNDPDSADEVNSVEVTQPTEPLIAGVILRDGINVLWSSQRVFRVLPSQSKPGSYIAIPIQNSKGLLGAWALTVAGPFAYYRSMDGIYVTDGSSADPVSVTDADLYPIFPHDGIAGTARGVVIPPDDNLIPEQRFSFDHSMVRYVYTDISGNRQVLVYDTLRKGWFPWNYNTFPLAPRPLLFYQDEVDSGSVLLAPAANGKLYQVSGTTDDLQPIFCNLRPGSTAQGDYGNEKLWGDYKVDIDASGLSVVVTQLFNAEQLALPSVLQTPAAGRVLLEVTTNGGDGQDAISATIDLIWFTVTGAIPKIYGWEVMGSHYPPGLLAVRTIAGTHSLGRFQHIREFFPSLIAPANVTFSLTVDGATQNYTIPATGSQHLKPRVAIAAVKGKMFQYRITSTQVFKFFVGDSEMLVGEWGRSGPYQSIRPFGPQGP